MTTWIDDDKISSDTNRFQLIEEKGCRIPNQNKPTNEKSFLAIVSTISLGRLNDRRSEQKPSVTGRSVTDTFHKILNHYRKMEIYEFTPAQSVSAF